MGRSLHRSGQPDPVSRGNDERALPPRCFDQLNPAGVIRSSPQLRFVQIVLAKLGGPAFSNLAYFRPSDVVNLSELRWHRALSS